MSFDAGDHGTALIWYDCSDSTYCLDSGSAAASDSEEVATLTDRSGNSRDATQSTSGSRAVWRAAQQNGLGALDFSASRPDFFVMQNSRGVTRNRSGLTVVSVQRPIATNQYEMVCLFADNSGADRISYYLTDQYNGNYKQTLDCKRSDGESAENLTSSDVAKNLWKVLVLVLNYSAGSWQMYENGASTGSGSLQSSGTTSDTDSNADPVLMAYDGSGSYPGDDLFGEFVVYDSALNSTQVGALCDDLALKWDLYEVASDDNTSEVPNGSLSLAGQAPSAATTENKRADLPSGSLNLSSITPSANSTEHRWANAPSGSLSLTGIAPEASTSENRFSSIPSGSLVASGLAPEVATTENRFVSLASDSLSLTGIAPEFERGENRVAQFNTETLSLAGNAPMIATTEHRVVQIPVGVLALTGLNATANDGAQDSSGATRTFFSSRFLARTASNKSFVFRSNKNSTFDARN